jgi:hypothetical protein
MSKITLRGCFISMNIICGFTRGALAPPMISMSRRTRAMAQYYDVPEGTLSRSASIILKEKERSHDCCRCLNVSSRADEKLASSFSVETSINRNEMRTMQ